MSLVDLNGNPIRAQDAINPFTLRTVADFPPLNDDEIEQFIKAANDLAAQQVPLSIPAGLPVELLLRIGATFHHTKSAVATDGSGTAGTAADPGQDEPTEELPSAAAPDSSGAVSRVGSLLAAAGILE
jgi:hypothetical protein